MTTATFLLIVNEHDSRVTEFLKAWHENGRDYFERNYPNLDYDQHYAKTARNRRKYICLDDGTSGAMMVEKANGQVWGIRGYGRINPGHFFGHIEAMAASYRMVTNEARVLRTR